MSDIDLEQLLAEISPEASSDKKDPESDPAFGELERKIKGTPEVEYNGKVVQDAKGPSWPDVRDAAIEFFGKTHHLRVAVWLTRALLHTDGINGLNTGLSLLQGLIERRWESLYPRLDPADKNDPTERINILWELCEGKNYIPALKQIKICGTKLTGRYSLQDIYIASGKKPSNKKDKPNEKQIKAAFKKSEKESLHATKAVFDAASKSLSALSTAIDSKLDPEIKDKPDFSKLIDVLTEISNTLEEHLEPGRDGGSTTADNPAASAGAGGNQTAVAGSTPTGRSGGSINSRQDVMRVLDQICDHYKQNEPGSPVPLLLKRARQMVEKNFHEIMQDMGLDSAAPFKSLFSGIEEEKS